MNHVIWTMLMGLTLVLTLAAFRLYWTIIRKGPTSQRQRSSEEKCHLAVFLGSGGHTSEALMLLSALDFRRYTPRTYIVSEGDFLSTEKAMTLESLKAAESLPSDIRREGNDYRILVIPRARRVHQSLFTTPYTSLRCLLMCVYHVTISPVTTSTPSFSPFSDVLILNGPGTCFVLCLAICLNRFLGLSSPKMIYVESFARVKSLSLSGKLLRPLVDRFIVQWPQLESKGEYRGWLV
ncbi:hypothetical protein HGRIS_002691 [Hohenbuehelia grisea]|uniref:UDP-N-acetylglucosamine transferase subunit ALG14 n=1 Tax=Hohenbuehelia grisea TaxID=104357 RepID=A0ABR3JL84_9AGAR